MAGRPIAGETSVSRALRVVEVVAEVGDGVTPKSIARRLGYTLPTTYRLLATLVEEGYLVRLNGLRGYGLGYHLGELARRLADQVAMPWPAREILHDVHRRAEGAAYYLVFRDDAVVVAHLDDCPAHRAPGVLRVGEPAAAHATAAGKVLLAELDRRRLPGPLPPCTAQTLVDPDRLFRELARVRDRGVAVEVDELQLGVAGVAVPVRGPDGVLVGALGVSVAAADFAPRRAGLEHVVRDGARRVAGALSHRAAAG
jgi:DNA-binding IclR family transcriptional regulator